MRPERRIDDVRTRGRARRARFAAIAVALVAVPLGVVSAVAGAGAAVSGGETVGEWGPIRNWPTQGKHLILLPTNKVLAFPTGNSAYLWDLATDTFTAKPATFGDIHCAGHVTLADGSALVVGGVDVSPFVGIKVNARFDPATESWTELAPMKYARWYPTATTLGDGRVLAASGTDETKSKVRIPEVYDPVTNTWTELTNAGNTQSLYPFMYQLPNGKVYAAAPKGATEYLDVNGAGAWTSGPTSGWDNLSGGCCSESGAMYATGKIIRAGGGDPAHARTGVIDMTAATPQWREVESMAFPRRRHNMVVLADGSVMAVGGTRASDDVTQAVLEGEIWSPETEQWDTVAAMSVPRMYHSAALLLPDGRVVAAGGDNPSSQAKLTAQIYSPPYLFKGPRPAIASAPTSATYGSTFTVVTDSTAITTVALIRPGAPTHAIDMNQRYVPLSFTKSGTELTVNAPANGNIAPPGAYMLVVENEQGVPSVASWVGIGGGPPPPPPPPGAPVAAFTASPTSGTAPLAVTFSDASTGAPTAYAWDFDNDGAVDSTAASPSHTFTSAGLYTVKLTVSNANGADDEVKVGYINVQAGSGATTAFAPVADARVEEANPGVNFGTSFLRVDGAGDPDVETYLRFDVSGLTGPVASAKLRFVTTTNSSDGPAVFTAADNSWSEAGITWSNRPSRSTIGMDDKGSVGTGATVDFDVTSAVAGNGAYTFVLATTSSDGLNMNSREAADPAIRPQLLVTVPSGPPPPPPVPVAGFTASPTSGPAPLTVQFTDTSTNAESWAWDFQNDDGFESTAQNPQFTFTQPGVYDVRLQVENGTGGDEEIKTAYITVTEPPPPPPPVLLFAAVADAYVRANQPNTNAGTSTRLRVDAQPAATTYLKFDVSGLAGAPSSAKLRLYVVDPSANGGSVFTAGNGWTESGAGAITWNNAPPTIGSSLSTPGAAPLGTWVEFDVTSAITGNGTFTLAVRANIKDTVDYSSREGTAANAPQLAVTPAAATLFSLRFDRVAGSGSSKEHSHSHDH